MEVGDNALMPKTRTDILPAMKVMKNSGIPVQFTKTEKNALHTMRIIRERCM